MMTLGFCIVTAAEVMPDLDDFLDGILCIQRKKKTNARSE
jgi:hypothetical protein